FPTELSCEIGERLRSAGAEFGATTGRPRRTGWLDAAALRLAVRKNGMRALALTKLDVLSGISPLRICVGYRLRGQTLDEIPTDIEDLGSAEPVYETLDGFDADTRGARSISDLPPAARAYLKRIEALVGVPAMLVSVGPARDETIVL